MSSSCGTPLMTFLCIVSKAGWSSSAAALVVDIVDVAQPPIAVPANSAAAMTPALFCRHMFVMVVSFNPYGRASCSADPMTTEAAQKRHRRANNSRPAKARFGAVREPDGTWAGVAGSWPGRRFERAPHPRDDLARRRRELPDQALHLLARERIDVEVELRRLSHEGRVLHGGVEGAPQRRDALDRHVRRQEIRPAVFRAREQHLHRLPVGR